jgi:hypothetical protein
MSIINSWNFRLEARLVNPSLMQLCLGSYILMCVAGQNVGYRNRVEVFPGSEEHRCLQFLLFQFHYR